ncbi:MAG: CheA signal transduction histidine kinase [Firmicutes bacterium]|nr:CheA signal transduction histidine kinase [Bacillota bacterium]
MGYQFMKESIKMLKAFVKESTEHLQKIEDDILKLESSSDLSKCFDDIFCQIHIIKGLSSFFGLSEITRLSHQAELLLEVIRKDGNCGSDGQIVKYLSATKDALGEMIIQLGEACDNAQSGTVREVNFTYDVHTLVHDMEMLVQQYNELVDGGLAEKFQSEELKAANEEVSMVSNVHQAESELITFSLDGLAIDLVEDFLLEVGEHSTIIADTLLIKLDINPEDTETSGDLFRRVHTIKGNLGLVLSVPLDEALRSVFQDLLEVLQNMESLLAYVRDVKLPISSQIIDVCFETLDILGAQPT